MNGVKSAMKPLRKPHPPIWIGAGASRAIRRAARLADAWYSGPNGYFGRVGAGTGVLQAAVGGLWQGGPSPIPGAARPVHCGRPGNGPARGCSIPERAYEPVERHGKRPGPLFHRLARSYSGPDRSLSRRSSVTWSGYSASSGRAYLTPR